MIVFDPYAFGSGALSFALAFLAAGGFALIFKAIVIPTALHRIVRAASAAIAPRCG